MRRIALVLLAVACAHAPPPQPASQSLELVESEPVETTLDRPYLRDAYQVWPEMIRAARERIDLAEFYASDDPPSRLTAVIETLEAALERGVHVRFLADAGFAKTYPEVLGRLAAKGAEVRNFDVRKLTGGVLHAKYFLVDGREAYLGSQNFDWRSLTHIQELGVRFQQAEAIRELQDIFELDWKLAAGGQALQGPQRQYAFPQRADGAGITLVASPRGYLPDESLWDLPALVKLIDSATKSIRVQVLTFGHEDELKNALVRAAARGVQVQLLVSNWELRPWTLKELRQVDPRIEVRIFTIPPASGPFIPFARVVHAKYCVIDGGARGWVGTSNWEPDYFFKSRNVGLVIEGGLIPGQLESFFHGNWKSQYVAPFDRAKDYTPPKISGEGGR